MFSRTTGVRSWGWGRRSFGVSGATSTIGHGSSSIFDLLRAHGFEFVRVLGSVAGPSWEDRTADPRVAGYDAAIAGVTDLAFEHGLRVGWTIFGDTVAAASPAARQALVDRFLAMSKGREHKILFIEVANEGWQNGFGDRLEELQALGRSLNARTEVPITLTSPPPPLQCGKGLASIYGAGAADFLTLHFNRDVEKGDGRWGPVRQPLRWPELFAACRAGLPDVAANGEPVGPQSSVASESDPIHILTGAAGHLHRWTSNLRVAYRPWGARRRQE